MTKKKKKKWWTVYIEQTKNIVTFTHSPNKCHNIFTKHLFSVVIGHSFIFYYFILTYKKLTSQQLWNFLSQYNNISKKKKNTNGRPKKNTVTIVATMPPGTIATVQNKKKKGKVPHQISIVDEKQDTLNE